MNGTTIRANCPACGDVQITGADIVVRVCDETDEGSYAFLCPVCKLRVSKPASSRIVALLIDVGVTCERWHMPAELAEPHPVGEPFTFDDVLDFHLLLEENDYLAS